MTNKYNRRNFLKQMGVGCSGMYATTLLSGITNMGLLNAAAAANAPLINNNNYKALVCVYMYGGCDSFNMLVPRGTDEYQEYADVRTLAAIPQGDLLPISPLNPDGKQYGLNPSLPGFKNLFDNGKLAFVSNVGTLVEPTTLASYNAGTNIPKNVFSHSDQTYQWMTSIPQRDSITGWAGRMADILRTNNSNQNISMNISLNGMNVFQQGGDVTPIAIDPTGNGVPLITGATDTGFYESLKRQTIDNMLDNTYQSILHNAYANKLKKSKSNSFEFDAAIANATPINTAFPTDANGFGDRLKMIARTIAARNTLGVTNQVFFLSLGSFDVHGDFTETNELLSTVDNGLSAFYNALTEMGVENDVTTFSISDFGRRTAINGNGTDHAWGGNAFVMGGAVNGGKIYGQYPDLYLGSPLDVGGGRFIPTISTDEYFSDLALWFGASNSDLNQILPNIGNFWDTANTGGPVGFMN